MQISRLLPKVYGFICSKPVTFKFSRHFKFVPGISQDDLKLADLSARHLYRQSKALYSSVPWLCEKIQGSLKNQEEAVRLIDYRFERIQIFSELFRVSLLAIIMSLGEFPEQNDKITEELEELFLIGPEPDEKDREVREIFGKKYLISDTIKLEDVEEKLLWEIDWAMSEILESLEAIYGWWLPCLAKLKPQSRSLKEILLEIKVLLFHIQQHIDICSNSFASLLSKLMNLQDLT